jgi:tetratricopeptide (TPR) repeat protein
MRRLLLASLVALVLGTAGRLALETEASRPAPIRNPAFLPSGRVLRATSFGQRLLLSDLYWLRTVQYMGERFLAASKKWEALLPLAEIVTDLDPRHGYAYQVTGSNLAGLVQRYDEADQILLKGMRNLPDRWGLAWTMATNKFVYQQDYAVAADYARKAAAAGKRPELALLAANLSALADTEDQYASALAFLEQAEHDAANDDLKAELEQRRIKLATFMVLSRVERALAAYEQAEGRRAPSLSALVPRQLPALPADPSGGRLSYDPATGAVASTVIGRRQPFNALR